MEDMFPNKAPYAIGPAMLEFYDALNLIGKLQEEDSEGQILLIGVCTGPETTKYNLMSKHFQEILVFEGISYEGRLALLTELFNPATAPGLDLGRAASLAEGFNLHHLFEIRIELLDRHLARYGNEATIFSNDPAATVLDIQPDDFISVVKHLRGRFFADDTKFKQPQIGESEKAIARFFEKAKKSAPSVIFIDNVEAVFANSEDVASYQATHSPPGTSGAHDNGGMTSNNAICGADGIAASTPECDAKDEDESACKVSPQKIAFVPKANMRALPNEEDISLGAAGTAVFAQESTVLEAIATMMWATGFVACVAVKLVAVVGEAWTEATGKLMEIDCNSVTDAAFDLIGGM
ncbi:hypothetical protein HDU96_006174, partial [Phlyctochytrium bullatum]